MPIKKYAITTRFDTVLMPATGETVNSEPFTVPSTARALNVFMSALASTATWKLQCLQPIQDLEGGTEVWADVWTVALPTTTPAVAIQMSGFARSQLTSIPTTMIGGGVFRCVASADQSGAPTTFTVSMGVWGGA